MDKTATGMIAKCLSWSDSHTWCTKLVWVASVSPSLHVGTVVLGLRPNISHYTEVIRFGADLPDVPNVVVALSGIESDRKSRIHIDTWVDQVSEQSFRLHVRSGSDATLWQVKVSWFAQTN